MKHNRTYEPVEDEDDLVSPAQVRARQRLAEAGIKTLLDDGTTDDEPQQLTEEES